MKTLKDADIFGLPTFVMFFFFSNKLVNILNQNRKICHKTLWRGKNALEKFGKIKKWIEYL